MLARVRLGKLEQPLRLVVLGPIPKLVLAAHRLWLKHPFGLNLEHAVSRLGHISAKAHAYSLRSIPTGPNQTFFANSPSSFPRARISASPHFSRSLSLRVITILLSAYCLRLSAKG